ncbi:DUF1214 domain-containing protein [Pseudomonas nitroreducens]|uniref:DUF1214 domain-containing protein n=1 Tax=Pseudomonas nitroreducens TaxID=46680 RepID=UPI003CC823CC
MRKTLLSTLLIGLVLGPCVQASTAPLTSAPGESALAERVVEGRAFEAAVWGMPLVNFDAMRQAFLRDGGAAFNDVVYWSKPADWRNQTTTPNHSTLYAMSFVNLKDGPVVVEIPPASGNGFVGTLIDAWSAPMVNVGRTGDDKGQGARYLLLPPGYKGEVPSQYRGVPSATLNVQVFLRLIASSKDAQALADGVRDIRNVKVYPLAAAAQPPASRHIDMADKLFDGLARFDVSFYQSLARMVAEEPVQERDLAIMGQLRSLDIGKGLTFAPDTQRQKVLERAAQDAHTYLSSGFASAGIPIWKGQRQWTSVAEPKLTLGTAFSYLQKGQDLRIDERGYSFFGFYGVVVPPVPQVYLKSFDDARGQRLDGGRQYRLRVPAKVPASQFWAADVYDPATAGYFRQSASVGIDSLSDALQKNADGSVDLYFGAKAPSGKQSNWISTEPGKPFFVMFRFYGPQPAIVDRSWVLNDLEALD